MFLLTIVRETIIKRHSFFGLLGRSGNLTLSTTLDHQKRIPQIQKVKKIEPIGKIWALSSVG
jgi:hypothetical protein